MSTKKKLSAPQKSPRNFACSCQPSAQENVSHETVNRRRSAAARKAAVSRRLLKLARLMQAP